MTPSRLALVAALALALAAPACGTTSPDGSPSPPATSAAAPPGGVPGAPPAPPQGATPGAPPPTATPPAPPAKGPPPSALPFAYSRPDVGAPLTPAELDAATDELIALLSDTRYFDVVDERAHGWPENAGGYWFGTWWSGVTVTKQGGVVTYTHAPGGADNNGLRTAPFLEGACFAELMWGSPSAARLVRKLTRGFSSWALAMKRSAGDTAPTMLARAHYGANVTSTEGGRTILIDMSQDRPGEDNAATEYVHIPGNPTFGDIWVKNERSKDDMGQIFRALAQAQACVPRLDAAGQADLAQAKALYAAWSDAVESNGWGIPTLDKSLNVTTPPATETLAHYYDGIECPGQLMMQLLAHGTSGTIDCGNGISGTEQLLRPTLKNGNLQILRTHHEAAAVHALLAAQDAVALPLLQGLAARIETDVPDAAGGNVNPMDVASLLLHAANAGVPLTSSEVRFVHAHLHDAYTSYRAASAAATYHVFDPSTPDGTYPYEPAGDGLFYSDIGLLLGSCASPWRNPASRPLLDCARLLAAF